MSAVEYLSKDILEEAFLKSFAPYHYVQKTLGYCRVDARNRFVTAPTVGQKVYTILCATLFTMLYVRLGFLLYTNYYLNYPYNFYLLLAILSMQIILFTSNLIHVRFLNGKKNMELFIIMQEIERLMKIEKDKTFSSLQFKVHLTTVMFLSVLALGFFSSSFFGNINQIISLFSFIYCEFPFGLEISFCSNIMFYFALRVRFVNEIILNHLDKKNIATSGKKCCIPNKNYLKHVAAKIHDFKVSETDIYIREIIRGFNVYKNLYRFQMLLFGIKLFSYTLLTFEYILLIMKYNDVDPVQAVILVSVVALDVSTALFLCLRCELFFRWVKKTKLLTISVMSIYVDGPLREKAKRMYNILEEMPPNFSIYDMWHMDARLMLSLFHVITSFIVTLLQFAFL